MVLSLGLILYPEISGIRFSRERLGLIIKFPNDTNFRNGI